MVVMVMELLCLSICIKLAYTAHNKRYHCESSEPPCECNTCSETRDNEEYEAYCVKYY